MGFECKTPACFLDQIHNNNKEAIIWVDGFLGFVLVFFPTIDVSDVEEEYDRSSATVRARKSKVIIPTASDTVMTNVK